MFIKNRKRQKVAVAVEKASPQQGLVFIMHGLGGFKEQPHILGFAESFRACGFTVVRFDATNSIGASDGSYERATPTNYFEDLEDIIGWAKNQDWCQEPFVLAGSSLGGLCVSLYAQKNPQKVQALVLHGPVISGSLSLSIHQKKDPAELAAWKKTGWREKESRSKPSLLKRLPWSYVEDRMKYDLLPQAKSLTMPVLFIVGENDTSSPLENIEMLYKTLPGKKEICIIKGAPHTFTETEHLEDSRRFILNWLKPHQPGRLDGARP